MSSSRIASVTGVVGGLVWIVAAVIGWNGDADVTLVAAGLVLFGVSLAAAGYALVRTAPLWLRLVLVVATPALGYMVWITARDAFATDHTPVLVAGVLMVTAGLVGLGRRRSEAPPTPVHGRRAAR